MPTVSLTMIVRNEEANLPGCLASCSGLFDELIIVDTGSTDRTKEIAESFKDKHGRAARVFDFAWCDDFAAARNESVRHATGDWVMWLDADDRLDERSRENLQAMFAMPEMMRARAFYLMDTVSIPPNAPQGALVQAFDRIRLAPRSLCLWSGRLHETIALRPDVAAVKTSIAILHAGYAENSPARDERNIRIAMKWAEDCPGEPEPLFSLAVSLGAANRHGEAIRVYGDLFNLITRQSNPLLWTKAMELCGRCAVASGAPKVYDYAVTELEAAGSERAVASATMLRSLASL